MSTLEKAEEEAYLEIQINETLVDLRQTVSGRSDRVLTSMLAVSRNKIDNLAEKVRNTRLGKINREIKHIERLYLQIKGSRSQYSTELASVNSLYDKLFELLEDSDITPEQV